MTDIEDAAVEHVAKLFEEQDQKIAKAAELHQAEITTLRAENERLTEELALDAEWRKAFEAKCETVVAENERMRAALKEIEGISSLVFEQTRGRLFLINKTAAVALGADPKDFDPAALAQEKQ